MAVITEVNSREFDPEKVKIKLEDSAWAEEKVRNHETVVREAMEGGPVIPLKFLTLYRSKKKIVDILKKQYGEFRRTLDKLKNKAEWGLKAYIVDKQKLIDEINKEDEEIGMIKTEIASKPEGVKYFLEKKLNEKVTEKIVQRLDKYVKDIFEVFTPFSIKPPIINKLLPQELDERKREMVLNVSCLIPKEDVDEFKKTAARLHKYYFPKGLWLEYSGPWPPYNFINHGDKNKKSN